MEKQEKTAGEIAAEAVEDEAEAEEIERKSPAHGRQEPEDIHKWTRRAQLAFWSSFVIVGLLAMILAGQDRKEAAVLEMNSLVEARLSLNRKEKVRQVLESGVSQDMKGEYLKETVELLLEELKNMDALGKENAVLFTIHAGSGMRADLDRYADNVGVYAKTALRKLQSGATVYIGTAEESDRVLEIAKEQEIPVGKAAFVWDLIGKNTRLKVKDIDHLSRLSVDALMEEIDEKEYKTSYEVVTVSQNYELNVEETGEKRPETKEEEAQEETLEAAGGEPETQETAEEESETAGGETGSGESQAEGESSGSSESSQAETGGREAETVKETESETAAPETQAAESETEAETKEPETAAETVKQETEAQTEPENESAAPPSGPVGPGYSAPGNGPGAENPSATETTIPPAAENPAPTEPDGPRVPETEVPAPETTAPAPETTAAAPPSGPIGPGA